MHTQARVPTRHTMQSPRQGTDVSNNSRVRNKEWSKQYIKSKQHDKPNRTKGKQYIRGTHEESNKQDKDDSMSRNVGRTVSKNCHSHLFHIHTNVACLAQRYEEQKSQKKAVSEQP